MLNSSFTLLYNFKWIYIESVAQTLARSAEHRRIFGSVPSQVFFYTFWWHSDKIPNVLVIKQYFSHRTLNYLKKKPMNYNLRTIECGLGLEKYHLDLLI